MTPVRPAYPQRKLNPKLREAARAAMLKGSPSAKVMSIIAGFPNASGFSDLLHKRRISETPLNVARFRRLAELLNFDPDEIFLEEPEVQP